MGQLTISVAMFNSYVKLPEGIELGPQKETCCFTTKNPAARLANWPQIHAHFKMIKPELKPVNPHICRLNADV